MTVELIGCALDSWKDMENEHVSWKTWPFALSALL